MLFFERATIEEHEVEHGPLPHQRVNAAFLILLICMLLPLPFSGLTAQAELAAGAVLAVILARAIAFDLAYLILPNVYVVPLIFTGLFMPDLLGWHSWVESLYGAGVGLLLPLFFVLAMEKLFGLRAGMGGGDIKMLCAVGAWLGPVYFFVALIIANLFALILAFTPKHNTTFIPFGPGIGLALWVVILFKNDIQHLLNTITLPTF